MFQLFFIFQISSARTISDGNVGTTADYDILMPLAPLDIKTENLLCKKNHYITYPIRGLGQNYLQYNSIPHGAYRF